ncbi:unnamed protein product [Triticum turgidum subsp. durum]|uniref:Uncharacterized protein n=1 Tax=Triticum turgidum subsp. durum TaxID=4567 RepID=A0A9R0Q166_TRITD|nr:unnamed protein product [Triticum turgidum subsp. durum]
MPRAIDLVSTCCRVDLVSRMTRCSTGYGASMAYTCFTISPYVLVQVKDLGAATESPPLKDVRGRTHSKLDCTSTMRASRTRSSAVACSAAGHRGHHRLPLHRLLCRPLHCRHGSSEAHTVLGVYIDWPPLLSR